MRKYWRRQSERADHDPSPRFTPTADQRAQALQLLAIQGEPAGDDDLASSSAMAKELLALGAEHRSLAEQLEGLANRHLRIAARQGQVALDILAGESALPGSATTPGRELSLLRSDDSDDFGPLSESNTPSAPVAGGASPVPDLVVDVLGPMKVIAGGVEIAGFRSYKIRTLFQYLVLNRRPTHREVLMELLWPGNTFGSARNNLNVCIYGLRRILLNGGPPRELIVYRDGWYLLNPEIDWRIDRDDFCELAAEVRRQDTHGRSPRVQGLAERAVSLYRGPLFEGEPAADWFLAERRGLRDLYIQTLEVLVSTYLQAHDVTRARMTAERMLQEDSSRESGHRLLMRCHAELNQRDLVVRQYRICRETLAELGIAPSSETVRLYDECTGTAAKQTRS